MSPAEIAGTVLGVIGVALMVRQNAWGWPVGLVQVLISAWVFLEAKLYSDVLLQGFFFAIQAYGWWNWRKGSAGGDGPPVTRLGTRAIAAWVVTGGVATLLWGEVMRRGTDAALPHWDAFILIFSIVSQWLQARKRLENWAGWMAVNFVAVGVYWERDLRGFALLYLLFLAMAVWGHVSWRRALEEPSRG
ncbi:MAG: nicotinamide riboside transporter PnuC [Opitutaceae bacterium]